MRNPILTRLHAAVRSEITLAFMVVGFVRPRQVARTVCASHADVILKAGACLAEDALTHIARREMKSAIHGQGSVASMSLPGIAQALLGELPAAISIPCDNDSEDEGGIYKPLPRVTLAEFEAHLLLLSNQIAADRYRHGVLQELHDIALAMGATPGARVFDVLGANQHSQKEVA